MIPNWNRAMENASGKYIKILPADDIIYPECLEKQYKILNGDIDHTISMVCCRRNVITDAGKVLFSRGFSSRETSISGFAAINKNIRSGGNIIGEGGAVMFRREIIEKTGNFNSDIFYVLDLDLWYKILLHGNLHVLPSVLSAFRVSAVSASVAVVDKQYDDVSRFIRKIYSQKHYKVSALNCKIGIFKAYVLTMAKKILYKYIVR